MAKVLLIGWAGASWSRVHPLLDRGLMPRLQRFLTCGTGGELRRVRPFASAAQWASIASGKRPTKHRILFDAEPVPGQTRSEPPPRSAFRTLAIWNILQAAGFKTHVANWIASHPAEQINGISISDRFADGEETDAISPERLRQTIFDLRITPESIDPAALSELIPGVGGQREIQLRKHLARTTSIHTAFTWAIKHEPWDFAAVRYDGLAQSSDDTAMANALLRFHDMMFGSLLELAGPDTSVILASDDDLIAVGGTGLISARFLINPTVCDITPTILSLFGLPMARDMDGQLWSPPLSIASLPEPRRTWEQLTANSSGHTDKTHPPTESFQREQQYRLGEAWADGGQHDRAAEIFADLVQRDPKSVPYRSALAESLFWAKRRTECRQIIQSLQADGIDTPLARTALAALDVANRQLAHAHLQSAVAMAPKSLAEWNAIGWIYLRIRLSDQAKDAFTAAIRLDPDFAAAHDGLAIACLLAGDPVAAEVHAQRAVHVNSTAPDPRFRLATALLRQKKFNPASQVLHGIEEMIRPEDSKTHLHLATLFQRCGDFRSAQHHRAIAEDFRSADASEPVPPPADPQAGG